MTEAEQPILSVTEISQSLKSCVERVFDGIRVRGEVSGLKTVASGHTYFSLKDPDSVLSAICWRGRSSETMAALREGLEVICTGKLSTYPGRSTYQMIVESAEPAGIGALLKLLNDRREKLAREGLFDPTHKRPIPFLPTVIGVITSPTGAVIRDIMHRLNDRFPRRVLLWPVPVQGDGAADRIAAAVDGFNALPPEGLSTPSGHIPKPDVLIVARGGGSLEDLWCFNEESVVRSVYRSGIPVISAVGHETDTTLIDYVADLRAPTPTGAAEKAVPVRLECISRLQLQYARLAESLIRGIEAKKLQLQALTLPNLTEVIHTLTQRLDDRSERLTLALGAYIRGTTARLETAERLLKSYSYHAVLERGFALVSGPSGSVISRAETARQTSPLQIVFADGTVTAVPAAVSPQSGATALPATAPISTTPARRRRAQKQDFGQGDLFEP